MSVGLVHKVLLSVYCIAVVTQGVTYGGINSKINDVSPAKEHKCIHTVLYKKAYQDTVFENGNLVYKKVPRGSPCTHVTERTAL